MVRTSLGTGIRYFVIACVVVAIWQAFNGDPAAILNAAWSWVQAGADLVTRTWESLNGGTGGHRQNR